MAGCHFMPEGAPTKLLRLQPRMRARREQDSTGKVPVTVPYFPKTAESDAVLLLVHPRSSFHEQGYQAQGSVVAHSNLCFGLQASKPAEDGVRSHLPTQNWMLKQTVA